MSDSTADVIARLRDLANQIEREVNECLFVSCDVDLRPCWQCKRRLLNAALLREAADLLSAPALLAVGEHARQDASREGIARIEALTSELVKQAADQADEHVPVEPYDDYRDRWMQSVAEFLRLALTAAHGTTTQKDEAEK